MRLLATTAVLFALAVAPAGASARVPLGFIGVNVDGLTLNGQDLPTQFVRMTAVGVESVNTEVNWAALQPQAGQPPNFTRTDSVVLAAAERGMSVLDNVTFAPAWARADPAHGFASPPQPGPYAEFLRELIARYGPSGSLWAEHPEVARIPVRDWQVWNEPSNIASWSVRPYQKSYVRLLRTAHAAIKQADPGARVVLAGLTRRSWLDVAGLYKAGAHGLFDAVSLHPYTRKPQDVLLILKLNRHVMDAHGDRRMPILVTELGWPSGRNKVHPNYDFEQTEQGQAAKLRQVMPLLAAARERLRIQRVYWQTWLTPDVGHLPFDYSGLNKARGFNIVPKPALAAYSATALRLEGCKRKGATIARCG